jgi:serine/threonine-protein kinase
MYDLGKVYLKEGPNVQAEQTLRKAVSVLVAVAPAGDALIGLADAGWGRALLREKRYVEAEKQLAAGYAILTKQAHPPAERMREARQDLAAVYDALKEPEKAARFRAELAATDQGNAAAPRGK